MCPVVSAGSWSCGKEIRFHFTTERSQQFSEIHSNGQVRCRGHRNCSCFREGLKKFIQLYKKAPVAHHSDLHKVEFLSFAVAGYLWVTEQLTRVESCRLNFRQLYEELRAQLQLSRELRWHAWKMKYWHKPELPIYASKKHLVFCSVTREDMFEGDDQ